MQVPIALQFREKWRTFADVVAAFLGINVWVSLVIVPGVFISAFSDFNFIILAMIPLAVLGTGVLRRSETWLLLGFPIALLLPVVAEPHLFDESVFGPIRFTLVATGIIAYMFGASVFTFFHELDLPDRARPLSSAAAGVPRRWRRRFRIYNGLAIGAALFPTILLATLLFDQSNQDFLRRLYPGRAESVRAVFSLIIIATWAVLYYWFFYGALKHHRTGDRTLVTDLALLRKRSRLGRLGLTFYVGIAVALLLMLVLLTLR